MTAGGPAWATHADRDDVLGGVAYWRSVDAGNGVTIDLAQWVDHEHPADPVEVTITGTLPADPVGLLRVAGALSEAAGLLL